MSSTAIWATHNDFATIEDTQCSNPNWDRTDGITQYTQYMTHINYNSNVAISFHSVKTKTCEEAFLSFK